MCVTVKRLPVCRYPQPSYLLRASVSVPVLSASSLVSVSTIIINKSTFTAHATI
ncbi:hypothetical protein OH76DRAFT_1397480 [Lentinus brumalis]|uniref:Uncharacterized protein n=1 Tax=Lentinus brumalis TaxID=2498619 RepID=A0A371DRF9_9APHY|nr:hypothetical protein OH76DRAFT_1397480 [Polyporus brumalis]